MTLSWTPLFAFGPRASENEQASWVNNVLLWTAPSLREEEGREEKEEEEIPYVHGGAENNCFPPRHLTSPDTHFGTRKRVRVKLKPSPGSPGRGDAYL